MGNLILCHDRHAAHPYEITRIHCRILQMKNCATICVIIYI